MHAVKHWMGELGDDGVWWVCEVCVWERECIALTLTAVCVGVTLRWVWFVVLQWPSLRARGRSQGPPWATNQRMLCNIQTHTHTHIQSMQYSASRKVQRGNVRLGVSLVCVCVWHAETFLLTAKYTTKLYTGCVNTRDNRGTWQGRVCLCACARIIYYILLASQENEMK